MARKRVISRTVKTTHVRFTGYSKSGDNVDYYDIDLPYIYTTDKALNKALEKSVNDDLKVLAIVSTNVVEKRYAMPEEEFIKIAKIVEE